VAQQIYLYLISVHILLSKSRVTVATESLVLPASSGKVVASGGNYSIPDAPQKEKMKGVVSGNKVAK
jgi:hypothetical protein